MEYHIYYMCMRHIMRNKLTVARELSVISTRVFPKVSDAF